MQPVSNAPGRTADVVNLRHLLETKLQIRRAHAVGICPIRRELYTQCFGKQRGDEKSLCRLKEYLVFTVGVNNSVFPQTRSYDR